MRKHNRTALVRMRMSDGGGEWDKVDKKQKWTVFGATFFYRCYFAIKQYSIAKSTVFT